MHLSMHGFPPLCLEFASTEKHRKQHCNLKLAIMCGQSLQLYCHQNFVPENFGPGEQNF